MNIEVHGGVERVELCELKWLRKRGHTVTLYAASVTGRHPHVKELRDLGYRGRFRKFYYYLRFGFATRKCRILHGHYTPLLALLFPERAVIHFHGMAVAELALYRYFTRRYHRARYVFCAENVKEEFRIRYPDIPEDRLHVVYGGADTELIRPSEKKTVGEKVNFCFYAGWIPEKGIYDVLKAAEDLFRQRDDFVVWFGGSAYAHYKDSQWGDAAEIDEKVKSWAARIPAVKLVGDIRENDLPGFLSKMDVGLVPSTYNEPFGLVPVEMMAAGIPVIAYATGGIVESVIDGKTGILVTCKDVDGLVGAMEQLLDNKQRIVELGKNARTHVESKFSWERHVEDLLAIYGRMPTPQKKRVGLG